MTTPFYARTPESRQERAHVQRLCDTFGTHRICARAACGRSGRCTDQDMRTLPACFWRHRGPIRFFLRLAMIRLGIDPEGRPPPWPEDDRPLPRRTAPSFLDIAEEAGIPIDGLRRAPEDESDEWTWERDERALALLKDFETRAAERLARRPAETRPQGRPTRSPGADRGASRSEDVGRR